jgi:hypothetical protein
MPFALVASRRHDAFRRLYSFTCFLRLLLVKATNEVNYQSIISVAWVATDNEQRHCTSYVCMFTMVATSTSILLFPEQRLIQGIKTFLR